MKTLIITFALIANFAILGNAQTIVYGYDLAGKQYYIKNNLIGREEINLSTAPAGVYFLRITLDGKQEEWKIVKQ